VLSILAIGHLICVLSLLGWIFYSVSLLDSTEGQSAFSVVAPGQPNLDYDRLY